MSISLSSTDEGLCLAIPRSWSLPSDQELRVTAKTDSGSTTGSSVHTISYTMRQSVSPAGNRSSSPSRLERKSAEGLSPCDSSFTERYPGSLRKTALFDYPRPQYWDGQPLVRTIRTEGQLTALSRWTDALRSSGWFKEDEQSLLESVRLASRIPHVFAQPVKSTVGGKTKVDFDYVASELASDFESVCDKPPTKDELATMLRSTYKGRDVLEAHDEQPVHEWATGPVSNGVCSSYRLADAIERWSAAQYLSVDYARRFPISCDDAMVAATDAVDKAEDSSVKAALAETEKLLEEFATVARRSSDDDSLLIHNTSLARSTREEQIGKLRVSGDYMNAYDRKLMKAFAEIERMTNFDKLYIHRHCLIPGPGNED